MFRFRLQRLLELREQKEQEAAGAVAGAQSAADAARDALASLDALRSAGRDRLLVAQGATDSAGELRAMAFMLEQLDRHAESATERVTDAEGVLAAREEDLRAAFRDRRVLDRLRERAVDEWRHAETQQDRQTMDGIALSRFTLAMARTGRGE